MGLLFDFFPIILFFLVYKFYGIFAATAVAIGASFLQVGIFWFKNRRFEITHILTFIILIVLGGATLISKNPMFIKWKPTVAFWALAILFLGSQFIGERPLFQRMIGNKIELPARVWKYLNYSWICFFLIVGAINLYVAYHFSTDTWVYFKLFGVLGATLIFGIAQSFFITKYSG